MFTHGAKIIEHQHESIRGVDSVAGGVIYHSLQATIFGEAQLLRSKSGRIVGKRDDGERRGAALRWSLGPRIARDDPDLEKGRVSVFEGADVSESGGLAIDKLLVRFRKNETVGG